jgi:hypothetical protein
MRSTASSLTVGELIGFSLTLPFLPFYRCWQTLKGFWFLLVGDVWQPNIVTSQKFEIFFFFLKVTCQQLENTHTVWYCQGQVLLFLRIPPWEPVVGSIIWGENFFEKRKFSICCIAPIQGPGYGSHSGENRCNREKKSQRISPLACRKRP